MDPRILSRGSDSADAERASSSGVSREDFRDALSQWATGVTIVAVRDDQEIQATTVGSLTSISDNPPTVGVSLTGSARILPYLGAGVRYGISVLGASQARVASVYADTYPVGPSPFDDGDVPLVAGAILGLRCRVREVLEISGSHLVIGTVEGVVDGSDHDPLIYFGRSYRSLDPL